MPTEWPDDFKLDGTKVSQVGKNNVSISFGKKTASGNFESED